MSIGDGKEHPIDLERVVIDPEYRRSVIAELNGLRPTVRTPGFGGGSPAGASSPAAAAGGLDCGRDPSLRGPQAPAEPPPGDRPAGSGGGPGTATGGTG